MPNAKRKLSKTKNYLKMNSEGENPNREFIRRLANDFVHYKIYGRGLENKNTEASGDEPFLKTMKTMQTVTKQLEEDHSPFFEHVCQDLDLREHNARDALNELSEEVLIADSLNWGRVVSLFTFGGKLAEWFWKTHQEDKIEEVESWLTESISSTDEWIERKGGWEDFNQTFNSTDDRKVKLLKWFKVGICASLAAAILTVTYKMEMRCKRK